MDALKLAFEVLMFNLRNDPNFIADNFQVLRKITVERDRHRGERNSDI